MALREPHVAADVGGEARFEVLGASSGLKLRPQLVEAARGDRVEERVSIREVAQGGTVTDADASGELPHGDCLRSLLLEERTTFPDELLSERPMVVGTRLLSHALRVDG
nr:hypothetical protein [Agrococcus jenensis]